jgi:hypothetical protein
VARPLAIASGTLCALALLAASAWVALNRTDVASADDGDLRLALSRAAVAENGFDRLASAASAARLPNGEANWDRFHAFRAGRIWDPQWIAELVVQNAPATALLHDAVASPAFAFPPPDRAGDYADRLATLVRAQQLIALSGAQSRILLREGDARGAIELASLGLHVGRRVSGAENVDLLAIRRAIAFQTVSLLDLENIARTARLAPADALALGRLLESTRWRAQDWQRVFSVEYDRLIAEVDAASEEARDGRGLAWPMSVLPSGYRWHRNRTVSGLADLYRDQLRKSEMFCADAQLVATHWVQARAFGDLLAPNAMGQLAIGMVRARGLDSLQLQRCALETHVSLVAALVAAKAWSDAEGALPERLEDLVPRYLDALPLDRYDGAPLRYARAARAVYSVGPDFTDAGPATTLNWDDPRAPGLSLAF